MQQVLDSTLTSACSRKTSKLHCHQFRVRPVYMGLTRQIYANWKISIFCLLLQDSLLWWVPYNYQLIVVDLMLPKIWRCEDWMQVQFAACRVLSCSNKDFNTFLQHMPTNLCSGINDNRVSDLWYHLPFLVRLDRVGWFDLTFLFLVIFLCKSICVVKKSLRGHEMFFNSLRHGMKVLILTHQRKHGFPSPRVQFSAAIRKITALPYMIGLLCADASGFANQFFPPST